MRVRRRIIPLLLATFALAGCDSSPAGPSPQTLAGSYVAEKCDCGSYFGVFSFTSTQNGATTDWLERGAVVQLTLAENGTTSGRLFVPGGEENGSDLDANLSGTWTLNGTTVQLSHAADTFLRDMPLTVVDSQLVGDRTFSGVRVRLSLQRR